MISKTVQIFQDVVVCQHMGDPDCPNNRENLLHVADTETELVAISLTDQHCRECPHHMASGELIWRQVS